MKAEDRFVPVDSETWALRSTPKFADALTSILNQEKELWMSLLEDLCDDRSSVDDCSVTADCVDMQEDGMGGTISFSFEEYWNPGCRDAKSSKQHFGTFEFRLDETNNRVVIIGPEYPERDPDFY